MPWYEFIFHLKSPHYSGSGGNSLGLYFTNPVATLFLPQRSFLLGLPIVFSVVLLWGKGKDRASAVLAGLLTGMLPLFHAHAAMALVPCLVLITPKERWKEAPWAIGAAALFGIPEALYFTRLGPLGRHLALRSFWMADEQNPILFWFRNAGLIFPAAILALRLPVKVELKRLAVAGLFLFVLGNTFQLARWIWDNYKIFFFAWLFVVPAVVMFLVQWEERGKPWRRWSVGLFLGLHLISGTLDTWRVWLPTAALYREFDAEARAVAEKIRTTTPVDARLLQSTTFNTPVVLSGRRTYLGFIGHVWSHGWHTGTREAELKKIFAGKVAQAADLQVDYALVGPQEKKQFPSMKIPAEWTLVFTEGAYDFYRLRMR